ncbi:hypothetical protein [Frigoriflavimonas asaccharolytica]|uniref:Lipoprotein n=1 Tax=Frigoriflavimonas asaccharolytica TaxID=2735899 RepID=A0A8J8GA48_9FLAO|nr:hypothetical protein [Frigoriflavimonas asaccharolytica]NRS92155.1 hypothetical protein [Frigoriflavimonas asaccharolytica]
MARLFKITFYYSLLLITFLSCEKQEEQKTAILSGNLENSNDDYFKGVIILEENGLISSKSKIKIILNGNDVQRDVSTSNNENYGLIYKRGQDSVVYYYKKDEKYYHTAIPKEDFQKWADSLIKPKLSASDYRYSSSLKEPFGTIFSPFEHRSESILLKTFQANLKNYGIAKCQTFLIGKDLICNVIYSESIKVRPEILSLIEYHQPKSIPTLALEVLYTTPESKNSADLPDKILNKLIKVSTKLENKMIFKSINNLSGNTIELPKNSIKISIDEMSDIIIPPNTSNGSESNHHHHHDFF